MSGDEGARISRRNLLKTGLISSTAVGLSLFSGTASAWDKIDVDLQCPDCEKLGKIELTDDNTAIKADSDLSSEAKASDVTKVDEDTIEFTVDLDDDDDDETVTIDFTKFYRKSGDEIIGFDFVTDGTGFCRVDVMGGPPPYVNSYRDLGYVIRGTEFFAPQKSGGERYGVSHIDFYYCPALRACVLEEDNDFSPASAIDVTADDVRFGIWWGPRHYKDAFVFDNGAAPDKQEIGDFDSDSSDTDDDDICFEFSATSIRSNDDDDDDGGVDESDENTKDGVIDDPRNVKNPDRMKGELLVQETDGDKDTFVSETQKGIVVHDPTPEP